MKLYDMTPEQREQAEAMKALGGEMVLMLQRAIDTKHPNAAADSWRARWSVTSARGRSRSAGGTPACR